LEPTPQEQTLVERRISRFVGGFERVVVIVLIGLLVLIVSLSTVELAWLFVRDLKTVRTLLLDLDEMLELFGVFLLVLIGMELLTSLKAYLTERLIHMEVVLEVAMVALAQKVIILDSYRTGGLTLLGLAALILALTGALIGVRTRRWRARTRAKASA
jgi:uncharacterized membrane protein (DUF373 family)